MKKAYLLIIAAALAFAGCSKNGPDTPRDPNAWMYDESLPLPVMLGTPGAQVMTKAGIDGASLPENSEIGVLGLEFGNRGWTSLETTSESVLMDCQTGYTVDGEGNININPVRYYPLTGGQNFAFYGFHPYVKAKCENNGTASTNSYYKATYTVDGKTDILWAESEAKELEYTNEKDQKQYKALGYNAAYIRKVLKYIPDDEQKGYMPNLDFKHKLTALDFKLRAYEDAWPDLQKSKVKVTGLTILNTYTKADLIVASLDENSSFIAGSLTGGTSTGSIAMEGVAEDGIELYGTETTGTSDTDGKYQDAEFGNGLLLVPGTEYKAQLTMTYVTPGTEEVKTCYPDLSFKLPDSIGSSFEEGKRYTLTIIVRAPQEVQVTASLTEWENVSPEEEIVIDQINNGNDNEVSGE